MLCFVSVVIGCHPDPSSHDRDFVAFSEISEDDSVHMAIEVHLAVLLDVKGNGVAFDRPGRWLRIPYLEERPHIVKIDGLTVR